jgi:hypothetical protein
MIAVKVIWGKLKGSQPSAKRANTLKYQAKQQNGVFGQPGAHVFGGGDAGEEASERDQMRNDIFPVKAEDGDAEKDDVARHGIGEDMAMVEINDGIEQPSGRSQKHGVEKSIGWRGRIGWRHGGYEQ